MFHQGDLQSGIALAMQQSKAVLCFVHGHSQKSRDWEDVLVKDEEINASLSQKAVCLRLKVVSRETVFLGSFCPIKSTPAIVIINNGTLVLNLQSEEIGPDQLKERLSAVLMPSNPAPSAPSASATTNTAQSQPAVTPAPAPPSVPSASNTRQETTASETAENVVYSAGIVQAQEIRNTQVRPTAPTRPPTAPARSPQPVTDPTSEQSQQRADYVKIQKDREQKARDERERIKQQIKSDREERRRMDQIRKQTEGVPANAKDGASQPAKSSDIRIQVRMFDGTTQRKTFAPSSTISTDVRSWIDSILEQTNPYTLKIILTPLPNRTIEAGEEDQSLTGLGIRGSCTLVMVPVKGYVDSYADATPNLITSVVTGGYNLVTGAVGAMYGVGKSVLGMGRGPPTEEAASATSDATRARIRTLADQRAEAAKRDQQFYNGNQLNFQPRKDEDDGNDDIH